jgi:hypothetical protein
MSYDDKSLMQQGFRVRHKYKRRPHCHSVCERCGVKRRKTSSGWEYFDPARQPQPIDGSKSKPHWTSSNPPCVKRESEQSDIVECRKCGCHYEKKHIVDGVCIDCREDVAEQALVRAQARKPEPFTAKAELTNDDMNVLAFFFHFVGPWADRAAAGFHDPEIAHHRNFYENWQKFADILKRLYDSTGATEYMASLSVKERRALGRKIARAVAQRAKENT